MAEIFTDFAQLKSFIGGGINTSMDIRSLEPVIYDTARAHLVPYLSQTFYDSMVAAATSGSPTAPQTALLPFIRRALAKLTIYEYQKIGNVEMGESGLHRIETETRKSAYKYQEKNYKDYFLIGGYNDIETMLKFLSDNAGQYTTWANTDEALAHRNSILNYSSQFRLSVQRDCDRWTFETLRPLIQFATEFQIQQVIPVALYDGLITRYKAVTLTAPEKELLTRMRKAIAHRAISEAIKQRWVQYKDGRVSVTEYFGDSADANQTLPPQAFTSVYWQGDMMSQQYTKYWIKYMNDNPTLFPTAFDVASGGTSTDTDAWHINSSTEAEEAAYNRVQEMKKPIFSM